MGLVDIAILVILCFFLIKGIVLGLLKEICSLLGLVLGGLFAVSFHVPLAQKFQGSFDLPDQVCVWLAFLAIFFGVILLFSVIGFVLNRFVDLVFLGGFNRLAGGIFGLVQGVLLLAVMLMALNSSVAPKSVRQMVGKSQLAPPFIGLGLTVFSESKELIGI
ncbi:MAG: colicin V production protein [Desulfuromonas sp.]|nr:MAG: colicin V production protein [Desulfuromonas sp.]